MEGSCREDRRKKKGLSDKPEPWKANRDWPAWRGENRRAEVAWLPEALPHAATPRWSATLSSEGLGGLAVAEGAVVVGCRDITDSRDVFYCLEAETGEVRWQFQYPARASFDYGNSPRATPVIRSGRVWTFGASGHLHCLDLATGAVIWQRQMAVEFQTPRLEWGLAGSPLLEGDRLIVQPGGLLAGLVALDAQTGEIAWQTSPGPPGHSSFIAAPAGDATQLIGYDEASLGGWSIATGQRLWGIVPRVKGDFNVPTPLIVGDLLVVCTENNAARAYRMNDQGIPDPNPVGVFKNLAPDASSPVAIGQRVYGVMDGVYCLDASTGLKEQWLLEHDALVGYASLIASPPTRRLLVLTLAGRLLLIQDDGNRGQVLSDLPLTRDGETHSHPAVVGQRLYYRIGKTVSALDLAPGSPGQ